MIKLILIILLGVLYVATLQPQQSASHAATVTPVATENDGDRIIAEAAAQHTSNIQVAGQGTVIKVLKDDNDGHRHQRFILRLANGHTLLVAHNIELAPRLDDLQAGDSVAFYGEYEWNPKGGVVHWTHHDPRNTHPDGWLKHHGHTYQ